MEDKVICIDTSILIEYFRKTNKENSTLFRLVDERCKFAVSSITKYEIYCGSNESQLEFWNELFENFMVYEFGEKTSEIASNIYKTLKKKNKLIGVPDILIAASAIENEATLATLNKKDFDRVDNLMLFE